MPDKIVWCDGCKQQKGIVPELIQKYLMGLGCCPVCGTQWTIRELVKKSQ